MKKFLFLSIFSMISFVYAEKFKSCDFRFINDDFKYSWNMSHLSLEVLGVNNSKAKIYENICGTLPNAIISLSAYNKNKSNLVRGKDDLYHLLVNIGDCTFEYSYGVRNDKFVTHNTYADNCKSSSPSNKTKVLRIEKQSDRNDDKFYNVFCSDGNITILEKDDGLICLSSGDERRVNECRDANNWNEEDFNNSACP